MEAYINYDNCSARIGSHGGGRVLPPLLITGVLIPITSRGQTPQTEGYEA